MMTRSRVSSAIALVLLLATTATAESAAKPPKVEVKYWPYDFTATVSAHLLTFAAHRETRELRQAGPRVTADYLCGEYTGAFDFTGGFALDIFPDGIAILAQTSDIGPPVVMAEGPWTLSSTGISFGWKRRSTDSKAGSFLRRTHGECREMALYLTFTDREVRDVVLVSHEFASAQEIKNYFLRRREFVDWQAIRSDLEAAVR